MNTEEIMTRNVKSCRPETSLSEAAVLMWDYDCGALPVVDDENRVMGMITDRDIAIATATKGRLATDINVGEVMSGDVYACALNEDINSALKTMSREKGAAAPGHRGQREAWRAFSRSTTSCSAPGKPKEGQTPEIPYDEVMSTFKAVCEHLKSFQAVA